MFKERLFHHIIRLNPNCLKKTVDKLRVYLRGGFNLRALGDVPEKLHRSREDTKSITTAARKASKRLVKEHGTDNIEDWCLEHWGVEHNTISARWDNNYLIYVTSSEMLYPTLVKLADKFKMNIYFAYVEDSNVNMEDSCGLGRVGSVNHMIKMPEDKFERFAFAATIMARKQVSFKYWESKIEGSLIKYYKEHFLEDDARERIEDALLESPLIDPAISMVENRFGITFVWNELTKYFRANF